MIRRLITPWSGATAAAVLVAALGATPASAQLDADAVKCRSAIAKAYTKLVASAGKTIGKCHKLRNKNKIWGVGDDCNDLSVADNKNKLPKAQDKVRSSIEKSCVGPAGDLINKDLYLSCPDPCGTDESIPNPMQTFDDLGDCLACLAGQLAEEVSADTLGMPASLPLSKDDGKCHGAIVKGYQKYMAAGLKEETKCQATNDKAGNNDIDDCLDTDAKSKVSKALGKANDGIDKSCAAANLTNVDSCATDSLANLKSCNGTAYDDKGNEVYVSTFELPATICPTSMRTIVRAGCSIDGTGPGCSAGGATESVLSVGWKGLGHRIDIVDNYAIQAAVDCPGTEIGSCGDCDILGIDTNDPDYSFMTRCVDFPWISCDAPFGVDTECSGGECAYYLGPPLPVSAGGTPTCTMNKMVANLTGTADPDAGTGETEISLRSIVHSGVNQAQPCPVCENDTTPRDGIKNGTCVGGARNNQACDVQGFDFSFSTTSDTNPTDGVSMDCPPNSGANISGGGLRISFTLSTGASVLPFGDACESPNESEMCACGVCSHDNTIPCNDDTTCDDLSGGSVCGKGGDGVDRKPNDCTGFTCLDVGPDDLGECDGDVNQFCEGLLRANGGGVLTCVNDASCDTYNSLCAGGDCGNCTEFQARSCFLDPITVSGTPDTDNPVLAGLFCLPPTSSTGVNSSTGSPGPGEVKLDAVIVKDYN